MWRNTTFFWGQWGNGRERKFGQPISSPGRNFVWGGVGWGVVGPHHPQHFERECQVNQTWAEELARTAVRWCPTGRGGVRWTSHSTPLYPHPHTTPHNTPTVTPHTPLPTSPNLTPHPPHHHTPRPQWMSIFAYKSNVLTCLAFGFVQGGQNKKKHHPLRARVQECVEGGPTGSLHVHYAGIFAQWPESPLALKSVAAFLSRPWPTSTPICQSEEKWLPGIVSNYRCHFWRLMVLALWNNANLSEW